MLNHSLVPVGSTGGYSIDNSLRFNDGDSAYLSRTPSSAGNRKTWTWSGWVKRGNLSANIGLMGANGSGFEDGLRFEVASNRLKGYLHDGSSYVSQYETTAVCRDPSAWYHILWSFDSTNSTESDRSIIYINGVRQDLIQINSTVLNGQSGINNTIPQFTGSIKTSTLYHDGYLAEVNFIDGQALDPSNFGETGDYGEWKPIKYTGTYGTNGFYLDFENSGSLGADVSGNSNNWTPNNLAATDQMLDSPTNNFATLNPLNKEGHTLSEGNLLATCTADWVHVYGTQSIIKNYFESQILSSVSPQDNFFGISTTTKSNNVRLYTNGTLYKDGTTISSNTSFTTGDIIGMAVDVPSGTIQFYKNGSANGNTTISTTDDWVAEYRGADNRRTIWNFGQDSSFAGNKTAQGNADDNGYGDFYYTPPTGFLALCTQNLPEPTVVPSEHFNTVLYTGDFTNNKSITGVGFQPDWLWIKGRTGTQYHMLFDAVRGNTKELYTNTTDAEATDTGTVTSFDSDGFTIDADNDVNRSGTPFVAWNWKANGAGVSNTNGTITSTVSANVDAGFSIVSYTGNNTAGATVGHGLSKAPEMVIVKNRDTSNSWFVWGTKAVSASNLLLNLNSTGAEFNPTWADHNDTFPDNTLVTLGYAPDTGHSNTSGDNFIMYAFHSVDGYSKVGSYTGNGSADGPFVHCGFRPAYIMGKKTTGSIAAWFIYDMTRSTYNPKHPVVWASDSAAEYDSHTDFDTLSNGFKIRATDTDRNGSGETYIFLAFAEHPFKYSNAR